MAEGEPDVTNVEEDEAKVAYKPPAEKSISEILKTDEDDESLRKYKEQLLGNVNETTYCKYSVLVTISEQSIVVFFAVFSILFNFCFSRAVILKLKEVMANDYVCFF